ncbi:MAG: RNA polymerase sigma factor, partial [Myxococcota bacterium]
MTILRCDFDALFLQYRDQVFAFLYKLTQVQSLAEDLMVETFVSLYELLQEGEVIYQPRAWLFRVARRKALNWMRDRKRQSRWHQEAWEAKASGVVPQSQATEQTVHLRQVMAKLKPQQAMLLHLYYVGLNYEEIAE